MIVAATTPQEQRGGGDEVFLPKKHPPRVGLFGLINHSGSYNSPHTFQANPPPLTYMGKRTPGGPGEWQQHYEQAAEICARGGPTANLISATTAH